MNEGKWLWGGTVRGGKWLFITASEDDIVIELDRPSDATNRLLSIASPQGSIDMCIEISHISNRVYRVMSCGRLVPSIVLCGVFWPP
jgi:hypothetical protein